MCNCIIITIGIIMMEYGVYDVVIECPIGGNWKEKGKKGVGACG